MNCTKNKKIYNLAIHIKDINHDSNDKNQIKQSRFSTTSNQNQHSHSYRKNLNKDKFLPKIQDVNQAQQNQDTYKQLQKQSDTVFIKQKKPTIKNIFKSSILQPMSNLNDILLNLIQSQSSNYSIVGLKQVKSYKNKNKKRRKQNLNQIKRTQSIISLSRISQSAKSQNQNNGAGFVNKEQLITLICKKEKQFTDYDITGRTKNTKGQTALGAHTMRTDNAANTNSTNHILNSSIINQSITMPTNTSSIDQEKSHSLTKKHNVPFTKSQILVQSKIRLNKYKQSWQKSKKQRLAKMNSQFPTILDRINQYRQKIQRLQESSLKEKMLNVKSSLWEETLRSQKDPKNFYNDIFVEKIIRNSKNILSKLNKPEQFYQELRSEYNQTNKINFSSINNSRILAKTQHQQKKMLNSQQHQLKSIIKLSGHQKIKNQLQWLDQKDKMGYIFKFIDQNRIKRNSNTSIKGKQGDINEKQNFKLPMIHHNNSKEGSVNKLLNLKSSAQINTANPISRILTRKATYQNSAHVKNNSSNITSKNVSAKQIKQIKTQPTKISHSPKINKRFGSGIGLSFASHFSNNNQVDINNGANIVGIIR